MNRLISPRAVLFVLAASFVATSATAQLNDVSQTPNTANAGIQKTLPLQVGAGRGDTFTAGSSIFVIERDPFRAIRRGRQIFQRKFTMAQGLGPRTDDGVGNIMADASHGAGLADSCASCHGRPRGSAGFGGDVFTRPDSRDAPHLFGLGLVEMLADEITRDLRLTRDAAIVNATALGQPVSVRLGSKGLDYGKMVAFPNGTTDMSAIKGVNADLRVRPFFAEGSEFSIRAFAVGAFNAEMGLEAPDIDLKKAALGQSVITPAGLELNGAKDVIGAPPAAGPADDPDHDGVKNEIDVAIVDYMEFYLLNYFKPATYRQTTQTVAGRRVFDAIQCATCHVPDLQIDHDRRVANVETAHDPVKAQGNFNDLFATAATQHQVFDDGAGLPTLKLPTGAPFLVKNIFADFKRHDLGPGYHEVNFDGTITTEFMTEPLWGVGSSSPYGHDGRSATLREAILRHGGEAKASRDKFAALSVEDAFLVEAFLGSLVLFPPDDTASNLNPGNPSDPNFPQKGHGSILLPALFNDPTDKE